jgi:ElaA protein
MTTMPTIDMEWQGFQALTADRLYELLRFRQTIFVVEQGSAYPDLDGLDRDARHLLSRSEGELVGYLRLLLIPDRPLVRIGRVAVAAHWRRCGLGRMLVKEALRLCREDYPERHVALSAQAHLVAFYASLGFAVVSEPYDDFGVRHVDMKVKPGA